MFPEQRAGRWIWKRENNSELEEKRMADWWKDEELVNQVMTEANGGNTAAQCEMARKCMAEQDISEAIL